MTKNALLLQYTEQTEPFSFINSQFSLWHFVFANGSYSYYELINFPICWVWFFLFWINFTILRNRIQILYVHLSERR